MTSSDDAETGTINIYFSAPTYQDRREGKEFKAELEKKFGLTGEEESVGTGADGPGLVFLIELGELVKSYGGWALLLLTQGKDITEVVTFYVDAAKKLAKYVNGHHTYLEREGAYILAVNAVIQHLGGTPKSIVLEGYMIGDYSGGGWDHMVEVSDIGKPPPHAGAFVPHYFQFKIDGKKSIKAVVDPDGVKVFKLPSPKKPRKRGRAE